MMYHLEVLNTRELPIALSLICQFDNENYFEAIFEGTNKHMFKKVLPILYHSYLRRIYLDDRSQSLNYTLKDKNTSETESFQLSLTGREFDFKLTSHLTGIMWVNQASNIAFSIRYRVEISNLSYASYDPLLPQDQTYRPYNTLIPLHGMSCKGYPISFENVLMKGNYMSYVVETSFSSRCLIYNHNERSIKL